MIEGAKFIALTTAIGAMILAGIALPFVIGTMLGLSAAEMAVIALLLMISFLIGLAALALK